MKVCSLVFVAVLSVAACAADPSTILLETERSSARVSLHGGRVLSFKTQSEEVLWSPKKWALTGDDWHHGGIPLCWPWFGRNGPCSNVIHGIARKCRFELRRRSSSGERCEVVLGLKPNSYTREKWPHEFDLEYTIVLTEKLELALKTKNTGTKPFVLTKGFHPYFFIGDRDRTIVTGTDGMKYCDSRVTTRFDETWKGNLKLLSSLDHVFVEPYPTALHKIVDPLLDRSVVVSSSGTSRLVVWNPGTEDPAFENPPPGELAVGDWRHLVCVEPSILWKDAEIELKPGAAHEIKMAISLQKGAVK